MFTNMYISLNDCFIKLFTQFVSGEVKAESNPTVSLCTAASSTLHKKNKLVNQKWSLEC